MILDHPAVVPPTPTLVPLTPPPEPEPEPVPLPAIEDAPPPPPPPTETVVSIPGSPFHLDDVVQVIDQGSRHYGQLFIIGDVKNGKAHGFYIAEGGKKEFITVPEGSVFYIGRPKVRAKVATSPKWISDHR